MQEMPEQMQFDNYNRININNNNMKFSVNEMEKIQKGYNAMTMDDKWNIVYEDGDINFLRSWTNTLVYKAHLVKKTRKTYNISNIMYNNDVVSCDSDDIKYMIMELLNTYVLN